MLLTQTVWMVVYMLINLKAQYTQKWKFDQHLPTLILHGTKRVILK